MTATRPRYCIRRNPGTGRWVLYFWDSYRPRPGYAIMGDSDTFAHAIEAVFA